eukprot:3458186-Lingulodinium_polyedra.AAC.1
MVVCCVAHSRGCAQVINHIALFCTTSTTSASLGLADVPVKSARAVLAAPAPRILGVRKCLGRGG